MNKFSLSDKEVPRKKREKQCYETGTLSPIKQPKGFKDPGLRSDLSPVEITWSSHQTTSLAHAYVSWSNVAVLVGGLEPWNFIVPYFGNNHPNWRSHIFQRGRYTTNVIILPVLGGWEEIVNQSIHSFPIPWDGWPWDGWPQSCILYWQL